MRRLALQTRNDAYSSLRDYQQTHVRLSSRISGADPSVPTRVVLQLDLSDAEQEIAGWGGYLAASSGCSLAWQIVQQGRQLTSGHIGLDDRWSRFGSLIYGVSKGLATLELTIPPNTAIDVWGLSAGVPTEAIGDVQVDVLNADPSLFPETLYLAHETAIEAELLPEESDKYEVTEGRAVTLKKCAYCGRLLPIDPNRLSALAFHKHNAKKTKHQNECRSCKKWKINDHFNPIRTPDQHHESSTITRERKMFLREPQILQELKDRLGEGLRTKIWNKFGRKCFRCRPDKPVALNEFQLDHTRPLAYLWPIDEFATCLCADCNNEKKEKFPIDFYTDDELVRLSAVTGLSLERLREKRLNQVELARILGDIENFARRWEPRTFFAVARKVRELEEDKDLEHILEAQNPELYSRLLFEYNQRPDTIDDEPDLADQEDQDEVA